jgi:hypothetical protein
LSFHSVATTAVTTAMDGHCCVALQRTISDLETFRSVYLEWSQGHHVTASQGVPGFVQALLFFRQYRQENL